MMAKSGLSDNEKRTLLGIVKYPTLNDRQLSERIDIKMSTVTAIKNRLKDMGYFITVRVPKLQNLGAELMAVSYAHTNSSPPEETQLGVGRALIEGSDEIFYIGARNRCTFSMSMHRNYSAAKRQHEGVLRLFSENGMLVPESYRVVYLPFDQAKVYNFFDYSRLLEQHFGIELPQGEGEEGLHDGEPGKVRVAELSRIERKVLRGLTDNPDLLDSSIAKRIDVTRQSVTKMRKRFQELDLFFTIRVPNLTLLGFELLALVHTQYRPSSTLKDRAPHLAGIYRELPLVFKMDTDSDGVEMVAFESYTDMERYVDRIVRLLRGQDAIHRDPLVLPFTLEDFLSVKNHVYTPALERVLEAD